MKKYSKIVLGIAAVSLALVSFRIPLRKKISSIGNYQTSWGKMGQSSFEPTDKGVGTLTTTSGAAVHSIKIKVTSGGVNLHKCEIWFNDGSKKDVELRNDVPAGSESREINLDNTLRPVSKIIFWYDTRNYKQRANIELWGKKLS